MHVLRLIITHTHHHQSFPFTYCYPFDSSFKLNIRAKTKNNNQNSVKINLCLCDLLIWRNNLFKTWMEKLPKMRWKTFLEINLIQNTKLGKKWYGSLSLSLSFSLFGFDGNSIKIRLIHSSYQSEKKFKIIKICVWLGGRERWIKFIIFELSSCISSTWR